MSNVQQGLGLLDNSYTLPFCSEPRRLLFFPWRQTKQQQTTAAEATDSDRVAL